MAPGRLLSDGNAAQYEVFMTGIELVKEIFTEATDDYASYLLWNHTGFPNCWRGDDPVAYFRQQLKEHKEITRVSPKQPLSSEAD